MVTAERRTRQPIAAAADTRGCLRGAAHPIRCCNRSRDFADGTVSANDCFRPVSRFFDRITRPEQFAHCAPTGDGYADRSRQLRASDARFLPGRAGRGMELADHFFDRVVWHQRRTQPDSREINLLVEAIRAAKRPLMIAGVECSTVKRRPRWLHWLRPLTSQWQKRRRARVRLPGIIHNRWVRSG